MCTNAPGEFRHHAAGFHAGRQHMPVVAVGGNHLIPLLQAHLHADNHGFLADIQMAKAANQPHAVKLAGLFLEPADQQHVAIGAQQFFARQGWGFGFAAPLAGGFCGLGHGMNLRNLASMRS
jgi:hypothetical protein